MTTSDKKLLKKLETLFSEAIINITKLKTENRLLKAENEKLWNLLKEKNEDKRFFKIENK